MNFIHSVIEMAGWVKALDVCAMAFAIYKAVQMFRDIRVPRKSRTIYASCDLGCAIAIMLALSPNFTLQMLGMVVLVSVVGFAWFDAHHGKLSDLEAKRRANNSIGNPHEAYKQFERTMNTIYKNNPGLKKQMIERKRRYQNDPQYRAKVDKQQKEILYNIVHHGNDPRIEHDMKDVDKDIHKLKIGMKQFKVVHETTKKYLNNHLSVKKHYKEILHKIKTDPQYKKSVDTKQGSGWREFQTFKNKVNIKLDPLSKQALIKAGLPVPKHKKQKKS